MNLRIYIKDRPEPFLIEDTDLPLDNFEEAMKIATEREGKFLYFEHSGTYFSVSEIQVIETIKETL